MFGGLLNIADTLRTILGAAESAIHDRVDLFASDLVREKQNLVRLLVTVAALAMFGGMTVILLTFTIIVALWDTARLSALLGLSGLYLLAFTFLYRKVKTNVAMPAFPSIRAQLKRDAENLYSREQREFES
jgi:uncharacterized membrane protein YqjE